MNQKVRPFFLLRILQEQTDSEHSLSIAQILKHLESEGFTADIRTIRDDLRILNEAGYRIEEYAEPGKPSYFSFDAHTWSGRELKILIDAVATSTFLSVSQSWKLIDRLVKMAPNPSRAGLRPGVLISEHIKPKTNALLSNVQMIDNAIRANQKISFRIQNYTPSMKKMDRHNGAAYVVSPYATVWMNDRYYLVGFSDKYGKIGQYRIDRMRAPRILQQPRVPMPEDFDLRTYMDEILKMFAPDPVQAVTLRCRNDMVDAVVDQFGENIHPENITEETFDVTLRVSPGNTFFGWLFQYSDKMEILSPENVREAYRKKLNEGLGNLE